MAEVWMKTLSEDFGMLPNNPVFSEDLEEEAVLINQNIYMAVNNGNSLETIKSIDGYRRFEQVLNVIRAHKQVKRLKENQKLEVEMATHDKAEADALEISKTLVIPAEITRAAEEYVAITDNEFDDFKKWDNAQKEWKTKCDSDLRYKVALLELRGKFEEALEARIKYVKTLWGASLNLLRTLP